MEYHCIRFLLFTINIVLDLCGFMILAAGLGTMLSREAGVFPPDADRLLLFPESLIFYGSLIAIIALVGTLGVAKESQNLLLGHMVLLLLLCAVELIFGIVAYLKVTDMTEGLKADMRAGMQLYVRNDDVKKAWNNMQRILTCCGVTDRSDWTAVWGNNTQLKQSNADTTLCGGHQVPNSCIVPGTRWESQCDYYEMGCFDVPYQWISKNVVPIGISIMSLFMMQLLALLLAVIMYGLKKLRVSHSDEHDTLLTRNHNHHNGISAAELQHL